MALFDDPNKALRQMQERLLAEEEEEEWEEEELDEALLEEFLGDEDTEDYEGCFREDYREEYDQEPFYRNAANGYGTGVRNFANGYGRGRQKRFSDGDCFDEEPEEEEVLWQEDARRGIKAAKKARKAAKKARKEKKKKGSSRWLVLVAILEIIAIVAIAGWWIGWIL